MSDSRKDQQSILWDFNNLRPFSGYLARQEEHDLAGHPVKIEMDYDQEQLIGWMCEPLEGVSLATCDAEITSPHKKTFYCDVPRFIFVLILAGRIRYSFEEKPDDGLQIEKNMFFWGDYSGLSGTAEMPVQKSYRHISFSLQPDMFARHFGAETGERILSQLRANLDNPAQSRSVIAALARPDVIMAGQRLFEKPVNSHMDVLELKSAAIDFITRLISLALDCSSPGKVSFSYQDIEAVKTLKARLEKEIFSSGNIVELCASIGMSRSKASQIFKHLYNTPIGQYQQTCRMVYAYQMLSSRQRNVSECAYELGYSNVGHFIALFRKQFERTPGEVFAAGVPCGDDALPAD